jgi:succinylglutamate desuccinylase
MHYFSKEVFKRDIVTVVFESGQHEEALSTNRAIAAIINCMRTVESVNSEDVENRHDHLLIEYSAGLPKVAELIEWYRVAPEDKFEMLPNYKNFQQVKKGQILAHDAQGPVKASNDGLLLMPKYQAQGDDGFFLIRELNGY